MIVKTRNKQNWFQRLKNQIKLFIQREYLKHFKNRGTREYTHNLLLRSSIYFCITYGLIILLSYIILFSPSETNPLFNFFGGDIMNLIWSPDQIFLLPFYFSFSVEDMFNMINTMIFTILFPNFIAGVFCGIMWGDESQDVVLTSPLISSLLFVFIGFTQYIVGMIISFGSNLLFVSMYVMLLLTWCLLFTVFSLTSGFLGSITGKSLTNFITSRKGSKIAYSALMLPEMPLTVKTIFDRVEIKNQLLSQSGKSMTMVSLNRRIEQTFNQKRNESICPYFVDNKCSYLGYLTAGHRLQICKSTTWRFCRVYAFIVQGSKIMEKANRGDSNVQ